MFALVMLVGVLTLMGGATWAGYGLLDGGHHHKIGGLVTFCAGILVIAYALSMPGGQLMMKQFSASGFDGNWLVIDNSGGETLRHWVLEDKFVESSSQSDGWQFHDGDGNLCYVSGDCFVMRINDDLDDFLETYKAAYNIPAEQEALH